MSHDNTSGRTQALRTMHRHIVPDVNICRRTYAGIHSQRTSADTFGKRCNTARRRHGKCASMQVVFIPKAKSDPVSDTAQVLQGFYNRILFGHMLLVSILFAHIIIHKELGDRMERAATTASSLEAEQDSGSGPMCQDTILGDVDAQTRSRRFIKLIDVVIGLDYVRAGKWALECKAILESRVLGDSQVIPSPARSD
ncbi:hypothetical protein Tco_0709338 [Tanacetum coccineum]